MDGASSEPEIFRQDKAGGRERSPSDPQMVGRGEAGPGFDSLSSDFLAVVLP